VALLGIVMDGDEAHAVIRAGPAAKIMNVRVGDDIGGWKVAQIEGRRLVLSLDDRIASFMMFAGNSANGAPPIDRETQSADRQSQGQTQPQTQMQPQNQVRQNGPVPPQTTQTQPQNPVRQNAPAPPPDSQSPGARKPHRGRG
jgi:hypothetical protein